MNKTELVDAIAKETDLSKAAAERALNAVITAVTKAVAAGDSVSLIGFGTFTVSKRAAREGRNPRSGEPIHIPERTVPVFKPGAGFKDAVQKAAGKKKKK
jgi:DNA-binding protein HU-beta